MGYIFGPHISPIKNNKLIKIETLLFVGHNAMGLLPFNILSSDGCGARKESTVFSKYFCQKYLSDCVCHSLKYI